MTLKPNKYSRCFYPNTRSYLYNLTQHKKTINFCYAIACITSTNSPNNNDILVIITLNRQHQSSRSPACHATPHGNAPPPSPTFNTCPSSPYTRVTNIIYCGCYPLIWRLWDLLLVQNERSKIVINLGWLARFLLEK